MIFIGWHDFVRLVPHFDHHVVCKNIPKNIIFNFLTCSVHVPSTPYKRINPLDSLMAYILSNEIIPYIQSISMMRSYTTRKICCMQDRHTIFSFNVEPQS
jgi:hypothetical protein